ncbi:tyrosine-type recombinase/integrase [bacterium AH-315-F18]|nr:tyrosine-type recombinase/integrase [bacterium AH-315-F18]
MIHLRWEDLVLHGDRPLVTVSVTEEFSPKDDKARVIPMHERLRATLRAFAAGKKASKGYVFTTGTGALYSRDNLLRELKRVAQRVSVQCHWYTLRHTFASHLVMEGVSIYKVSRFLGHASVTTTERHYTHLRPETLHEDINRIGRKLG